MIFILFIKILFMLDPETMLAVISNEKECFLFRSPVKIQRTLTEKKKKKRLFGGICQIVPQNVFYKSPVVNGVFPDDLLN